MIIKSTDYHDYVFLDGRLVGEFEDMYLNSKEIPWHQDEQDKWVDVRLTQEMMRNQGEFSEIHDLGCGTGHYLDLIATKFLAKEGQSFGYDISETACKKASETFPKSVFTPLDLTERTKNNEQRTKNKEQRTTTARKIVYDSGDVVVRLSKNSDCNRQHSDFDG